MFNRTVIQTTDQLETLRQEVSNSSHLAIDTETNYVDDQGSRFLVGISLAWKDGSAYIPVGHKDTLFGTENFQFPFYDLLDNFTGKIIFHNAKFDLWQLRGILDVPTGNMYDTMLMSHLIDENSSHGLKELAKERLGYEEPKKIQQGIKKAGSHFGYEAIPASVMSVYACQDAEWTLELYHNLKEDFEEYEPLWDREKRFLLLLLKMEQRGLVLDRIAASHLGVQLESRLNEIQRTLGFDPAKSSVLARKLFGVPPEGLQLKPRGFTSSGKPMMDEAALATYGHPTTALVIEYRTTAKQLSSYIRPYLTRSGEAARLYPSFKQHGTVTGRLSCENPNMQQIPRGDSPVKRLFLPESDCELWEFDYKNIEMRLAACYAREKSLVDVFMLERDVHGEVAKELGVPRHIAKMMNFLIIYGGGVDTLSRKTNLTKVQAYGVISKFKNQYPAIASVMEKAQAVAEEKMEIKYWTGRKRHFQYFSEARKAFNAVIQGGAFEIVKDGMLRLDAAGYQLVNQVHDSVWIQIPKSELTVALEKIPEIMSAGTQEAFGVPFTVDSKRLK